MFRENQKIGSYTLVRPLGRGGQGEVWLAERQLGSASMQVVLDLLIEEQTDREAVRREFMLWARLSGSPNILPIIDAGEEDGQFFIASKYLPEGSLEQLLETHRRLPVEQAAKLTVGILSGLDYLHSNSVILRDLNPGNVFLRGDTPLLGGFIISRAVRGARENRGGSAAAKSVYMSPEAANGEHTHQSDIWSVGVILYLMVTGILPFSGREAPELIEAMSRDVNESLPGFVSPGLKRIIARSLAGSPYERYQSAAQMREDLLRFLGGGFDEPPQATGSFHPNYCPPQTVPQSIGSPPSIAGDEADRERKTDSVGNLVKRVRDFFKRN